jgi:hypothetical protein
MAFLGDMSILNFAPINTIDERTSITHKKMGQGIEMPLKMDARAFIKVSAGFC